MSTRTRITRKTTQVLTGVIVIGMMAALGNGQTAEESVLQGLEQSSLESLAAFAEGVDAYIYGYPLVMIGITERVATTVPGTKPNSGRAPINQFVKQTNLPNGSYKDMVLPSTSTLYASAFLNLTAELVILHIPDIDR